MKNFRTYNLAVDFCRKTSALRLPKHLLDQLKRASSSVALNLAEGSGRQSLGDTKRFYHIAFGSVRECQAILEIGCPENQPLIDLADKLAAHLYCLIKS